MYWNLLAQGSVPILLVRTAVALLHPPSPAEQVAPCKQKQEPARALGTRDSPTLPGRDILQESSSTNHQQHTRKGP